MNENSPYLLDNDRYYLMGRAKAGGLPVILQCSRTEPVHYCVQYAGNGKYFDTLDDALTYIRERWGFNVKRRPRAVWTGRQARTDEE